MKEKPKITVPGKEIAELCRRYHIRKFSLFGSSLGDDFREDSDVDVLVEFEQDKTPGLFGIVRIEEEIGRIFGRKVDLRTPRELSRYFRDSVMSNARVEYARG
ncbi:MAG: nucleotidyltransferase domain-containing protein [Candidatus Altiarchaeota archaeon]